MLFGTILAAISAAEAWAFVLLNAKWTRWWQFEAGRIIMALIGLIAVILTLSVLRWILGDTPAFLMVRTVVFFGVPIVLGWLLTLLIRGHRRERQAR